MKKINAEEFWNLVQKQEQKLYDVEEDTGEELEFEDWVNIFMDKLYDDAKDEDLIYSNEYDDEYPEYDDDSDFDEEDE